MVEGLHVLVDQEVDLEAASRDLTKMRIANVLMHSTCIRPSISNQYVHLYHNHASQAWQAPPFTLTY